MGVYDTFCNGKLLVQIKMTNDGISMPNYEVGDEVNVPDDCIIIGYEGAVVVVDGKVVLVTENLFDKWGGLLCCDEIIDDRNELKQLINSLNNLELTVNDVLDI